MISVDLMTGGDLIPHFDAEFLYALPGDDTLDKIFTHANPYLRRDDSQNDRLYLASQLIPRRYLHACHCMDGALPGAM